MFDFFKKPKIKQWEIDLLLNIFNSAPKEYTKYKAQIQEGLIKNVRESKRPNHTSFSFNVNVLRKYEDKKESPFLLRGIKVFDLISNQYTNLEIDIAYGIVTGYTTDLKGNFKFDINNLKLNINKQNRSTSDYAQIKSILNEHELRKIVPNDVYEVTLDGNKYFHIFDLPDGEFIGIDTKKNVYKITHDPYEIVPLNCSLMDAIDDTNKDN